MITFENEESVNKAIQKFDNTAVDDEINRVRPFFNEKGESKRVQKSQLLRRVYLMNIPYDTTVKELETLVKEFAPIDEIALARDK